MTDTRCVICGIRGARVCSSACAAAAVDERARNVARWRQLFRDPTASDLRSELAVRNGELTSALIGSAMGVQNPETLGRSG